MMGTLAAVFGISFYIRNRETSNGIRLNILFYGLTSALWCIAYGLIGFTADLDVCNALRKIGLLGIIGFLLTETFMVTAIPGIGRRTAGITRAVAVILSLIDYYFFSKSGVDQYTRHDGWTSWQTNPDMHIYKTIHNCYVLAMFLILFSLAMVWVRHNRLRRLKRFLGILIFSNFNLLFFAIPDTVLPEFGIQGVSTSGIGAAVCTIVVWYGASRLNSFDISSGNIKDKLFDFLEVGVVVFDMERKVAMKNRYAGSLIQGAQGDNNPFLDFFDIDEDTGKRVFDQSLDEIYSVRRWDRDHRHAYSVRMSAIKDDFGDPFCVMCIFVDVTEEVEAIKRFEVASNAKSRFLAQMSHEIRTPINAVLGMNEMILRSGADEKILEYSRNIDSAGNTLLTLINSILDFSKIEDGKMDIVPVEYDTASFINDLYYSIVQRADEKGLALEFAIAKELPCSMIGDDVRISQVIMNLLTNAVKYTEKGSVKLSISIAGRDGDNISLKVAVEDTGIGIKDEDKERLFESFERLDEVRNHNIEGTGLGVSIVKNLLNMMGSRLCFESTYGEGSVFYFTIDQKIGDAAPIGDFEKRIKNNRRNRSDHDLIKAPGARVLVVDDNDMNLKVAANLLGLCDITPDIAHSGAEAIGLLKKGSYHIVFLDHMMPKMDGIETLKRIHKEGLITTATTMIALTANAVVGAREIYLGAGFSDYLSKPIELDEMVEKLVKYLPEDVYKKEEPEIMEVLEFEPMEEDTNGAGGAGYDREALLACGLDVDTGLMYCGDMEDMYYEILDDYVSSHDKKAGDLQGFYDKKEWGEYQILIHAVKSISKTIGSKELYESALELEGAARDGNISLIEKNHGVFLDKYESLCEGIKKAKSA